MKSYFEAGCAFMLALAALTTAATILAIAGIALGL